MFRQSSIQVNVGEGGGRARAEEASFRTNPPFSPTPTARLFDRKQQLEWFGSTTISYFAAHEPQTGVMPMGKKRDWNKEQPHHVDTGEFVKKDWAEKHPGKVEWVKNK
jgi:hypothetical protein